MKIWLRAVAVVLASTAAIVVAVHLSRFLEMDTCIDAGGRYVVSTGACDIEVDGYVPLFSRPRLYVWWALFLGGCFISGWAVLQISTLVLTKASAAQQSDKRGD